MNYKIYTLLFALLVTPQLTASPINKQEVQNVDFVADYYPAEKANQYGIIVLNGSAGGKSDFMAEKFSQLGYPVLSLAYFDWDNKEKLPNSLEMIPLEYVNKAKDWLKQHPDTKNDGVVVYGLSKGAELALLAASFDSEYKGVIATAPSSVVWSGIPQNPGNDYTKVSSSWSRNGLPVPFVPYVNRTEFRKEGKGNMLTWHEASLQRASNYQSAMIDVTKIKAPILLFSGGKDTAWPSNEMAASICAVANVANSKPCTHINYPDAPHLLGEKGPDARRR